MTRNRRTLRSHKPGMARVPGLLLALAATVALGQDAVLTHDAASGHADGAPDGLRVELVEDWASDAGARGAPDAPAAAGGQDARATASLVGRVTLRRAVRAPARRPGVTSLAAPASREVPEFRNAVVYLESAPSGAFEAREPMRGRIDQRNETFIPHVLAVTAGSLVDFPNNDRTYHNVFSLSKTKRFDLGRYAQGRSKAVRFDRPGIVRVFCDIHSHMSAFVLVFNHPFFATTDPEGRYRIDGIPAGTYTVAAWYEGNARETRTVTLPAGGGAVDLDFVVP